MEFNSMEMTLYENMLLDVHSYIDSLAMPLRSFCYDYVNKLSHRKIVKTLSLLPYFFHDLMPVDKSILHALITAQFYTCWYYHVQDELLDEQTSATAILGGHLALLKNVAIYDDLGITVAPAWQAMQALMQTSAEAYAIEMENRFQSIQELAMTNLEPFTLEFAGNRLIVFQLSTVAQGHLADLSHDSTLTQHAMQALRLYLTTRQIGDDAGDWLEDLQVGQLNYANALLLTRFYNYYQEPFDIDRLAGYQLSDETFWQQIEETMETLIQQSLACLAPHGKMRFQTRLIEPLLTTSKITWQNLRDNRAGLQQLFGISKE
ncbi:MAG: hypothetical protein B6242_04715 [Anaerolineaceae bacterium 4572_78]|nr:MAG: hypothetical protein B6242_04715 [Anaerolineaceae bacterium 4572_78]